MGLLSQADVPKRIPAEEMAPFEARFSSPDDVAAQLSVIIDKAIPPSTSAYTQLSSFLRSVKTANSQTAKDASRVGDNHLRIIFNAIATAGLHAFKPDVFGNPESIYNLVHEHLAIHTFRTIASAWAYSSFCEINLSLLEDYNLLRSFYRSFIFGYLKDQASKEERIPGSVVKNIGNNNVYRRREEVCFSNLLSAARSCLLAS